MEVHPRLKTMAASLAVSSLIGMLSLADMASLHPAAAEMAAPELTPVLLMETDTPKPAPMAENSPLPPVPTLDPKAHDIPPELRGITAFIPTRNVKELLGAPADAHPSNTGNSGFAARATSTPSPGPATKSPKTTPASPAKPQATATPSHQAKPAAPNCQYAGQLDLTHNQRFRLKRWKSSFVRDNQAAFDSIRIKRNLLKRLGKNPKSAREKQQAEELRQQIRQELKALQTKREAQIAHVLSEAQYDKWQALRRECQSQSGSLSPGALFHRNPEESKLNRLLRQY